MITLANGRGSTGALVLFNYANQVFSTLNAVLVLSIVLSVFPVLASRDGPAFDQASAGSTRAVVLAAWLGTALIVAVAVPAAHVLAKQPGQASQLVMGFVLFAPGLLGMGVIANLSRVMLAIGRLKVAAVAVAASWLLSMAAMATLAELVPAHLVVAALALGTSIGQIAAAIPLVIITRRIRGRAAVHGIGRATLAGLAAAARGRHGRRGRQQCAARRAISCWMQASVRPQPAAPSSHSPSSRSCWTTATCAPPWSGCRRCSRDCACRASNRASRRSWSGVKPRLVHEEIPSGLVERQRRGPG